MSNITSKPISLHGKCVRIQSLTCSNCRSELCNLKFYAEAGELEDTFGHVTVQDPEEQVAQKQVEEDLRIYGTRYEPSDAVDLGEDEKLSKLPPKRSASEFEAGVDRPAKTRKMSECRTFNYENVTAMDWNAGESPMMAWVNQSAVPAAILIDTSKTDPSVSKDEELLQQEKQEIEIFKNVHVTDAPVPANSAKFAAGHECRLDLDFGAQIYYRNIVDRYPLLPPYLTRRLAIANHNRAERLQNSRLRNSREMEVPSSPPSNNGPRLESQSDAVDKYINTRRMSSEWMTPYSPQYEPKLESQSYAVDQYIDTRGLSSYINTRQMSSELKTPHSPQYEPRLESQSDAVHQNVHHRRMSSERIPLSSARHDPYPRYDRYSQYDPYAQYDPYVQYDPYAQYDPYGDSHISTPLLAQAPTSPSSMWNVFEQPCQQACLEADGMGNGILINGERYACEACFDNNRVSSCYHTGRYSQKLRLYSRIVLSYREVC